MCAGEVQGPFLSFYFVIATVAGDVAVRHLLPGTSVHLAATEPVGGPKGLLDVLRLGASDDDPVHRLVPEQESQRILLQGDTGRNVVLLVYPLPPPRCSAFILYASPARRAPPSATSPFCLSQTTYAPKPTWNRSQYAAVN